LQANADSPDSAVAQGNPVLLTFSVQSAPLKLNRNGGMPMKSLVQKVQRFFVSEDGPTAVEYAVMLALIVIVCLTAISSVGSKSSATFNKVASTLPDA
jgi:pilus assembly protein Flp/PilA